MFNFEIYIHPLYLSTEKEERMFKQIKQFKHSLFHHEKYQYILIFNLKKMYTHLQIFALQYENGINSNKKNNQRKKIDINSFKKV